MPEQKDVSSFVSETWEDFKSPTTSTFTKKMGSYRNLVSTLEERLDADRSGLTKMKKSVKALYNSGKRYYESDVTMAENLENLSKGNIDQEKEINEGFRQFSRASMELSNSMNDMVGKLNSMLLYPLESFLKGDLKGVKGDMKKPFDKAWKEYDAKFAKIEKEKKQQAKEAGMTRTEVEGSEIAEDMLKERKVFQLQLCEYLIKVNDIKTKKGVDLLLHLVEYYKALTVFFQEGLKSIEKFQSFIEILRTQLQNIKQKQNKERQELVELRDALKNSMSSFKEPAAANKTPAGYSLHQLHGNKKHGSEKEGYLLKKSEGKVRKVWQRRRCIIQNGIMLVSHSDETKDPVKLNLLTCQVKLVADDVGKKCFDLVSSSNNRTYHFQGEDGADMEEWISVLNNAKEEVLLKAFQANTNSPSLSQNVRELTASIIDRIKRLPGNKVCCDCGAPDPEWLSTNHGVLICLECCGIHRQLGVHISRTQSIVIDELGTSQLLLARVVGNDGFNDIFEGRIFEEYSEGKVEGFKKLKPDSPMEERGPYIIAKYEKKKFIIKTNADEEELKVDLKQAVHGRDIQALLQIYAEGMDLMSVLPESESGETALHLAIENEDGYSLYIVDFIIQNSTISSLATKNRDGNTPLHICAIQDKTECMKLLLRTSPELAKITNTNGKTPLDIATESNHQLCADLLNAALSGRKDLFENVNIDWDLIVDEHDHEVDFSDDDLENTPERKKTSRPGSLLSGIPAEMTSSLSLQKSELPDPRDRADSTRSLQPQGKKKYMGFGSAKQRSSLRSLHQPTTFPQPLGHSRSPSSSNGSLGSLSSLNSTNPPDSSFGPDSNGPPLPPRRKPPPPPPPNTGHTRNKSEGNLSTVVHRRSTSDPPPRPAPPDLRNTICNIPGRTLSSSHDPNRMNRPRIGSSGSSDDSPVNSHRPVSGRETPPLPVPRQKKKSPIGQKCQAIYDCDADNEDELTFREGEIIIVIGEEEEEWWEGEIDGQPHRKGVFPKSFVNLIP